MSFLCRNRILLLHLVMLHIVHLNGLRGDDCVALLRVSIASEAVACEAGGTVCEAVSVEEDAWRENPISFYATNLERRGWRKTYRMRQESQ